MENVAIWKKGSGSVSIGLINLAGAALTQFITHLPSLNSIKIVSPKGTSTTIPARMFCSY